MDDNLPQQPQWQTGVTAPAQGTSQPPSIPAVRWSASEFISHQKGLGWYLVFGAFAGIVTCIVVLVSGITSGLVVAAASVAVGVYAGRQPATKNYEINEESILVDGRSFPYEMFKSFAVVEEGALRSIWLKPLRRYTPTLVMYFAPDDEVEIVDTLENFLPEESQALDVFERIARRIRF